MMDCLTKYSYKRHAARGGLGPLPPEDVRQGADGFWYRESDGKAQRVCEDCWANLLPYREAPRGYVSPESDGKERPHTLDCDRGQITVMQPLQKAVCRACLVAAEKRVYPNAPPHLFHDDYLLSNNVVEWTATAEA